MFKKPINRTIEGVIQADDNSHLLNEVEEYVITDEVSSNLENFFENYNNHTRANGVWISGFFGSGKSHLLKMLAAVLDKKEFKGKRADKIFIEKVNSSMLKGLLERASEIPSENLIFNIDLRANNIERNSNDAVLSVFLKVFNEHCGYYGNQDYIAQFERDLDERNLFIDFKKEFEEISGITWEDGRESVDLFGDFIDEAFAKVTNQQKTSGIMEKRYEQFNLP